MGTKYCIICGKTINSSKFFCSPRCASISHIFRANNDISTMKGFCNDCSKPLLLIKDSSGRFQSSHSDCNSIIEATSLKTVDINNNPQIREIIDSKSISSVFKSTLPTSISEPLECVPSSISLDTEKTNNDPIESMADLNASSETKSIPNFVDRPSFLQNNLSISNSVSQESTYHSLLVESKTIEFPSSISSKIKRKSYYHNLKVTVNDVVEYDDVLNYLPDFYMLICNIARGEKSSWYTKMLANAALSYLVLENDLIPDEKGAKGYIDDLFLCSYILKEIRDKVSKNVILENMGKLEYGDEIFQLIYDVVNTTSEYLEEQTENILKFVGLDRFTLLDFLYENDVSKKIEKRKEKKKMFYAMIAVKAKQILESSNNDSQTVALKSLIRDHYEFVEISTYMRFLDEV